MRNGNQGLENLTRQMLLTFIIAAASLYAVGRLAMALAPLWIGPAALKPDLSQFINPALASPKPVQRFVFLCVILSVVPVLALTAYLVRTFVAQITLRGHRPFDGAQTFRISDFSKSPERGQRAQWVVLGFVMIFAVYAGGYYRWFGADEVNYKFIDPVSLEAVIFSIMRISQGGTCLAQVIPQYGCYGEFFRPLWAFVPPSVGAVTTVFFLLYLVSIFAAMRFASRIIREPVILLLCGVVVVTVSSFYGFFDPDFQYWPLRTLFPCLALALAPSWQRNGANSYRALAMGVFSALAISWNLDSGIAVLLSLAVLIALSGCTRASSLGDIFRRERFFYLGAYCLGVLVTLGLLLGYLSLKAGAMVDLGLYVHFQRIFYISGYVMLPMPSLPHPWGAAAMVMLLALAALAVRILRGHADDEIELLGFAGILAIGVFVYYTGRSHIRVLETVSWLPSILLFCVADRIVADNAGKRAIIILRLICAGATTVFVASWVLFYGKSIDDRWIDQLGTSTQAAPLVEDADFIARETAPNDRIAVLAPSQGSLVLTAGRSLAWSGPGMIETAIWSDARGSMQNLRDHGPKDLFLDQHIRGRDNYGGIFSAFEASIRTVYRANDWEPNGHLLHLVRRKMTTGPDAVPYERPVQVSGNRDDFPLLVSKNLAGQSFQLELKVIANPLQERLAVLASSTSVNDEPFRGLAIYHQARMGQDRWALAMGEGAGWKQTPLFSIPGGRPVTIKISYAAPKLEIAVDDNIAFKSSDFAALSPTEDPLYIGDWIAHMYHADTPMDWPLDGKFGSPNYWKIQDRRFNGQIISARLLP